MKIASLVVTEPEQQLCEDAAATFAILASPVRIRLLSLLARGESDVGTLAASSGAGVTSTSQHLAKLRLAGLVSVRVAGRRHVYVVDDPHVISLVEQALDHHADLRATRARQVRHSGTDQKVER